MIALTILLILQPKPESFILKKGLNTVGQRGINAWGENDRYLHRATGTDKSAR
jgi:hypothetical protein